MTTLIKSIYLSMTDYGPDKGKLNGSIEFLNNHGGQPTCSVRRLQVGRMPERQQQGQRDPKHGRVYGEGSPPGIASRRPHLRH